MRTPLVLASALLAACGGGASSVPPSATPASAPAAPVASTEAPAAPTASTSAPPAATAAADGEYQDAESDPTTLTPLFDQGARPSFPKATASPAACWQAIALTGDATRDYETLEGKCGAPTGAVPYVKPAMGKLHASKDKRDTYLLHLQGGLCYRYFGVADGTVKDLDILILQAEGALVGDDKTTGPVAIIESDKTWCQDRDVDYQFAVEVDGPGTGRYVFGVWAQPK